MSIFRRHRFGFPYVWRNRPSLVGQDPDNPDPDPPDDPPPWDPPPPFEWTANHIIRIDVRKYTPSAPPGVPNPRVNWQDYWQGYYYLGALPGPSTWMSATTLSFAEYFHTRIEIQVGLAALSGDLPAEDDPARLIHYYCGAWAIGSGTYDGTAEVIINRRVDPTGGTTLYGPAGIKPLTVTTAPTTGYKFSIDPYRFFRGQPFFA